MENMEDFEEPLTEEEEEIRASAQAEGESLCSGYESSDPSGESELGSPFASEEAEQGSLEHSQEYGQEALAYEGTDSEWRESDEAEAGPPIDMRAIKRLAIGELGDNEAAPPTHANENEAPIRVIPGADPSSLPFLLAGPIVRRAEPAKVWFWFACREEVTRCTPRLTVYDSKGVVVDRLTDAQGFFRLQDPEWRVTRLGEHLWVVLVAARPKSDTFPVDWIYGYDLEIEYKAASGKAVKRLSSLGLDITYPPFKLPTFLLSRGYRRLAHGSCRRPGAIGPDAFPVFDQWLATQVTDISKRPSALMLTGDQIYADDVAYPLFKAVQKLASHVFGYVEHLPRDGKGPVPADHYLFWALNWAPPENTRKALTSRGRSPIGFTTEDGEGHLLSFAEYAAMYLLVWNAQLCSAYGVDDGTDEKLKGFPAAVARARRVLANTATYMLFDDHEITDDWNLDADWERATKNSMAQRILANGLAAYWAFQGWGNDPEAYDSIFEQAVARHFGGLRTSKGQPGQAAQDFDKTLLSRHWSFVAPTMPPALCVDTRTRRETPNGRSAILSGRRVWPFLRQLVDRHKIRKGEPLLIVLPTPFLPHRSSMWGQQHEYEWPRDRYQGDFEWYGNNPQQRAELVLFLHYLLDPPALVVFSGDVHHGSVIDGLYVHGKSKEAIYKGKGDWAMRIAQVTSSPIKNVKHDLVKQLVVSSQGNIGESVIPQFENQYATTTENTVIALRADAQALKGSLGRQTYIFENHLCVVDIPQSDVGLLEVLFVGVRNGALATASTSMFLTNKPSSFRPPFSMAQVFGREAEYEQPEWESPEASEELQPALAPLV